MEPLDVLDVYTVNDKIFMDLNPAIWIEFTNHEITGKFSETIPNNLEVYRTTTYNVAIYLKFDNQEEVNFNKKVYKSKVAESGPAVFTQLCVVFKNEWNRIPNFINFYKRVHNIDRFLLYDNNSEEPPSTEITDRNDVIYIPWTLPYKHQLTDKKKLAEDYTGPDEIIVAQNSAYSHALKKFHNASWTLFLDTDEFVVRRAFNPSLKTILELTNPSTDTLILRGYWAGCNKFAKNEIYQNLRKISRRSNKFCMNKLILRTSQHTFTDCIHRAYPTQGSSIMLAFEKGIYFFHLQSLSEKRNQACDCKTYCCQQDRSLIESCNY